MIEIRTPPKKSDSPKENVVILHTVMRIERPNMDIVHTTRVTKRRLTPPSPFLKNLLPLTSNLAVSI